MPPNRPIEPGITVGIARKLQVQLLGELLVVRDGVPTSLPQSRKTRALLAYLALAERPLRRDELCELLWDTPGDPRAALRWSLTKLRALLRTGAIVALKADRDFVSLDFDQLSVDLLGIRALMRTGPGRIADEVLAGSERRLEAGCLNGLDDVGSRRFQLWLESERKSALELHRAILSELVSRPTLSAAERLQLAGKKVALDPLDDAANIEHLDMILRAGGFREAQQAFYKARDHYRREKQDDSALTGAWVSIVPPTHRDAERDRPVITASTGDDGAERSNAVPDMPSLAVLNFRDLGSNGAVLAQGLTADLNSRLAQLPSLFVIARQSTARIEAGKLTPREVGAKLGVRYLVSGSTQREKRRVRTTVTLTDAVDESELWSEHYDRPLDDIFEVQDDITNRVIAAIEPEIERAEMQRALLKPPDSLSAWEYFHRGLWHCFRFTVKDNELAHRFFARALSLDPRFSRALAGISFTHYSRAFLNAVPDVEREIDKALDAGTRSVGFDGRDAMGHWALGRALYLSRQHDEALAAIERALVLNPSYAQGHYAKGFIGIHAGLDDASLSSLDMAQRLSPFDPLLFAMKSSRGISLANQRRYEEAATWAMRATHEPNAHFHIYAIAAACLDLAGRSADARNHARWVIERQPQYSVEVFRRSFPHKDEAAREPMLAALVRAGIPHST
jgi:TolB-like protein/DNA-binding SARP family transcriptional activator